MNNKNKCSIAFLLILTALFLFGPFNISYIRNIEDFSVPKINTGEIAIITPENKTYTEAMSGYYPATYGFENDINGIGTPMEWENDTEIGYTLRVLEEKSGHKKVVEFLDTSITAGFPNLWNNITTAPANGTIEMWLMVEDASDSRINFNGFDPSSEVSFYFWLAFDEWTYNDVGLANTKTIPNIPVPQDNTWFHLRIDFRCVGAPAYQGLSENTYCVIVNGISSGALDCRGIPINVERFSFTGDDDNTITFWIDSIGFSWDPNYNVGDNLNEGLLLSYDSNIDFDWQGYSLDGASNKPILGNTTIPMPSDGLHDIQVFGNDTMGTMYESEKRYFTVATSALEITINSPSESEIFGSNAPTYDISISGLYETIWYTLDGGATNITAIGLTGTIDQTEWDKLGDSIVTITFYANNSASVIGSAEVMIIKHVTDGNPPGVPGYNLIAILGVSCVITLLLIKKKFKK